jgi:hypothetical protein
MCGKLIKVMPIMMCNVIVDFTIINVIIIILYYIIFPSQYNQKCIIVVTFRHLINILQIEFFLPNGFLIAFRFITIISYILQL